MTLPLIGVGLSYVAVSVLLLSLNLASRWHWSIKAVAIVITEHFQLDWATVVEPDKLNGAPGSIYLWVEALSANNTPAGTPRAFRLPYSRELADRIGHAKERIEQGVDQVATARDVGVPEGPPDQDKRLAGAPPRQDEPGSPGDPTAFIQHVPAIEFEDMPAPALPPKRPL